MSNEERLAVLETTNTHIIDSLSRIENRLINLDIKVDSNFKLLDSKIDTRFDKLNDRMWTLFFWMIGGFASVLGILAHAEHWV